MADTKFDETLYSMLQHHNGELEFLNTIFGFIQRKSSFFNGPNFEKNFDQLIATLKYQKEETKKQLSRPKTDDIEEEKPKPKPAPKKVQPKSKAAEPVKLTPPPAATSSEIAENKEGDADKKEEEEDKGPKLIGNGGRTETYEWTQTLSEVVCNVFIAPEIRAKDVAVDFKLKGLKVGLKGKAPIIDGELFAKIKMDDCFWTIEESKGEKVVALTISKTNQMEWWNCVVVGDSTIDTTKVEPENSKLGDLDGDTRQTVEKMMFDQRQKQMGKPTSDEQSKQDMLDKFMKQHPEMDFSNAKIG